MFKLSLYQIIIIMVLVFINPTYSKTAYMNLRSDGSGTLSFDGKSVQIFADNTFPYVADITLYPSNTYVSKWSSEYSVSMTNAVGPIHWQRGAYIHYGSLSYSVGCPHLGYSDSAAFYNYVKSGPSVRLITYKSW
eukprot:UN10540